MDLDQESWLDPPFPNVRDLILFILSILSILFILFASAASLRAGSRLFEKEVSGDLAAA